MPVAEKSVTSHGLIIFNTQYPKAPHSHERGAFFLNPHKPNQRLADSKAEAFVHIIENADIRAAQQELRKDHYRVVKLGVFCGLIVYIRKKQSDQSY